MTTYRVNLSDRSGLPVRRPSPVEGAAPTSSSRPWPASLLIDQERREAVSACEACEHLRRRTCGAPYCRQVKPDTAPALYHVILDLACPLGRHQHLRE